MPRWHDLMRPGLTAMLAGAIASAAGTPAVAQPTAAPDGFGDAVRACVAAITPTGVDEDKMAAAGWSGTDLAMDAKDQEPLRVLTRGRGPLIVVGTGRSAAKSGCNVLSPLPAPIAFDEAVTGMSLTLGAPPSERKKGGDVLWVVGNVGTVLARAGRPGRPAIRATVIHIGDMK